MQKIVLIAEDYDDSREFLRYMLELLGYSVDEARNGWEAVEYVQKKQPDLILMDISMPDVDGLAATQLIRNIDGAGDIPIVIVTAHSSRYYEKALAAGCNEVVSKPIDLTTIKSVLSRYLPS